LKDNAMRRRDMFKLTAGAAMLAAPRIARAEKSRVLRFVPTAPLTALDPVWTGARGTRDHGYLVFDTLYGIDESLVAQPQMAAGHTIDDDGKRWTITLREKLRFHDGEPVLASDVVASIRRIGAREGFSRALMAATDELSAADDRRIVFRLKKPFPHLPQALGGCTVSMPAIMPARLAATDPFKAITEMVGSGPFRFVPAEFNAGNRAVYERFQDYVPRDGGKASFLAGAKTVHFDRVEWTAIPDGAVSSAALHTGEIDWVEVVQGDLLASLAHDPKLMVETNRVSTAIGMTRFNQLHPPFDNPAVRRALLGAIDQAEAMQAVAGVDPTNWHAGVGLFGPGSPLANDEGIGVMTAPRDYDRVKRELAAAGYKGERVLALDVADIFELHALSIVGIEQLRKAGMNVEVRTADFGTVIRSRFNKDVPDKGGWNVFFTLLDGSYNFTPASNGFLSSTGPNGFPGWATAPKIDELNQAWLDAPDMETERRVCRELQAQFWRDVPYIPMGEYTQYDCHTRVITDLPKGFPLFYGVRPA
jgi:peptide/nickel transport system substrate-binding protein